jgi:hypothetical protein
MKRFLLAAALLGLSGATQAGSQCSYAVQSYNSAVDDISYKLKAYARCVGSSNGTDDCSFEFRRLKYAQDEFESAVSNYRYDCD